MMLKGDLYPRFKESLQFKEMLRQEFNVEEPKKKKAKVGVAKEDVADLRAKAGGPMYSNCHVTINYVGQK